MQRVHKSIHTKSRRFCSVPQCASYCTKETSLNSFPGNKKLCAEWQHTLKIGKPISKYMLACSKHFLDSDFMPVTPLTKIKRLKKGVVPSQNLPLRKSKASPLKINRGGRKWLKEDFNPGLSLEETVHAEAEDGNVIIENDVVAEERHLDPVNETSSSRSKDQGIQTNSCSFPFKLPQLLTSDEKLRCFTGVDYKLLNIYKSCAENVSSHNNLQTENLEINLVLVLCKLKTNMSFSCLSVMFSISVSTCTRIFYSTLSLLSTALKPVIYWPTKDQILKNMPKCFENFKSTRVVLDCTEIKVQKLKCLKCRIMSYSHYKGTHTIKFLIGITPSGLICYVSPGYGGRATDKAIFNREKLIERLDTHDAIMVDKGVLIEGECQERFIKLIRPPFLKKQKQLTEENAAATADIARARVHVERAIQRIKFFSILNDQIDWYLIPYIDDIFTVIAATVNMSPPILNNNKF